MKKLLAFLLPASLITLGYFLYSYALPLFQNKSSLIVTSSSNNATVSLNDKVVGNTPYKLGSLKPGDYLLKIVGDVKVGEEAKKYHWEGKITIAPNSRVMLNRELGPEQVGAGEIIFTETGEGMNLISNPTSASVKMDDKDSGETPLFSEIVDGVHKIVFAKDGFLKRELTINKTKGSKLNISVNLANDMLLGIKVSMEEPNLRVFGLSQPKTPLKEDEWAENVLFSQEKYSSASSRLDLLIDYKGASYSSSPKALEVKIGKIREGKEATSANILIGYLSKDKREELSSEAQKSLDEIKKQLKPKITNQVEISNTPTGFLNVRATPSPGGQLKGQVKPGETYELLEENRSGWYKIKLKDGEGWVSSQYVKKKQG